jgi:hypothetical protein
VFKLKLKMYCWCTFYTSACPGWLMVYLQQAVYLLHRISKEYNLEIATEKTKVFGFVGTDHLRTNIIINDETLEQVSQFTYLGCSISYRFSNDVEF